MNGNRLRALFIGALIMTACVEGTTGPDFPIERTFSFETDLEGWVADTTDTGDPATEWLVERSTDEAIDGNASAKIEVNNLNDASKVWIERPFDLRPNTSYRVTVGYDLATADFGTVNNWTLITGVSPTDPEIRDDLAFQDETGNGNDQDVGYVWLPKSYQFDVITDDDGLLWVSIGVWGTWEGPRTYFFDDVQIRFEMVG